MRIKDLHTIEPPSQRAVAVRLLPVAERRLRHGHPWLFADSIRSVSHDGRFGDTAVLFDRKNRLLGVGLYDPDSPIRVRLLHVGSAVRVGPELFRQKLEVALASRALLLETNTTGYRLIHGENDGMGGLVMDRYGKTAVVKLYSLAWLPHLPALVEQLTERLTLDAVVLRLSRNIAAAVEQESGLRDGDAIFGSPTSPIVRFRENGLLFEADVVDGQKTGFFLDQRDNRARVGDLAEGKTVLNVFAYTGGFSVYALRGGARHALSLDMSEPALEMAERHVTLNRLDPAKHDTLAGDAFERMAQLKKQGRQFGVVVIDPPSFAKRRSEVARALGAYGRLVHLGVRLLEPGGVFVMSSCSSRVGAEPFFELVHNAAREAKRPLREMARTQHAVDHPITFPESAYLKCLFAQA